MYVGYLHAEFEKTLEIVGLSWWRLSGHLFGVSGNAVVLSASTNSPILALMSHFLPSISIPQAHFQVLPDFVTSKIESFQREFVFKSGYLISALVFYRVLWYIYIIYIYAKRNIFK